MYQAAGAMGAHWLGEPFGRVGYRRRARGLGDNDASPARLDVTVCACLPMHPQA